MLSDFIFKLFNSRRQRGLIHLEHMYYYLWRYERTRARDEALGIIAASIKELM